MSDIELEKHAKDYHGLTLNQFKLMCNEADKRYAWVGLSDDEIEEGAKNSWVDKQAFESAVWWADQKLKEKNHG